ncbi:Uncharacterised protein [Chryseobacterium nakagawai]|uniref:DUF8188 domain-containing protein n=1 Tax=Chryseobacterium nakagawai TaxID=1241982 RepID=A0AAD0YQ80_CHRNA|nr:hypothetical protein [Chryseobacterium nakagawai]AZA92623.1 hypothetical protein EG343_19475 [Chryseobacterium nakagawai]VEH19220.1 Uncharacterised protein [Chryseobacterium nakagawai]
MKNQFLQAIGYAIGVLILVPVAIYLINIFFFKSPVVTDQEINRFMENSNNTEIVVWFDRPLTISEKYLGRHSKTVSSFLSRNGSGNYNYTSYTFYNKSNKKYFSLLQLAESGYIFRNIKQGDTLNVKINKYFLTNENYGTLENPIPVLYYAGIKEAIRTPKVQTQFKESELSTEEQFGIDKNNDFDPVYMDRVYKASVFKYLTFIIPKKDYKKMFPK